MESATMDESLEHLIYDWNVGRREAGAAVGEEDRV